MHETFHRAKSCDGNRFFHCTKLNAVIGACTGGGGCGMHTHTCVRTHSKTGHGESLKALIAHL